MSDIAPHGMLPAAIYAVVFLIGISAPAACANGTATPSEFEEHVVEFHNQDVQLAGSLLLPSSEVAVPAVVFVHGAGRQTREPYREVAEFFASQGMAALIYDKRGVGQSSGVYESHEPYDNLVNDALAAVAFLKKRREIAAPKIGIWGLSQGAYISAAAASRSQDIQFIIGVGASVADRTDFYYRDNLFSKYGLSNRLRDLAEKAQLVQETLPHNLRDESVLSTFLPKSYASPDKYVHPAWSRVKQPVLAMWGQLDQHQPVGESILGLKNSLAQANNNKWTMIIVARAKHSLGISDTGAIQEKWRGYPPGTLKTMTDWAWRVIDHPAEIDKMKQVGDAEIKGILTKTVRYEKLRWYGNGTVQAALWMLFLISFLANAIAGVRYGFTRLLLHRQSATPPEFEKVLNFKRALGTFNLLILAALGSVTWLVLDQIHPTCPAVLMYLPVLGTVSTVATATFLIWLAKTPRDHGWTAARRIGFSLDVLSLSLFIPYLLYWNAISLHF